MQKVNMVRYADDFIITADCKERIENEIIPFVIAFLKERGPNLSAEKSKITHIDEGFEFLSQNVRKYRGICSKKTFYRLSKFIWWQVRRWAKYQHGNHNRWWIFHRYFEDKHFSDSLITAKGKIIYRLNKISVVPIIYHVKVKSAATPYLPEYDKYFLHRTKWRDDIAKKCKQNTTFRCTI